MVREGRRLIEEKEAKNLSVGAKGRYSEKFKGRKTRQGKGMKTKIPEADVRRKGARITRERLKKINAKG